jgi:hypothetical protein
MFKQSDIVPHYLPLVSFTLVVHIDLQYLREFSKKISNDHKVLFRSLWEDDSRKKLKQ